ncbi:unnamed protein product [Arabidopsis halleri]
MPCLAIHVFGFVFLFLGFLVSQRYWFVPRNRGN